MDGPQRRVMLCKKRSSLIKSIHSNCTVQVMLLMMSGVNRCLVHTL